MSAVKGMQRRSVIAGFMLFVVSLAACKKSTEKLGYSENNEVLYSEVGVDTEALIGEEKWIFDNISKLRLSGEAPPATVALLRGYQDPGDGGGGEFFWDSSCEEPDDGALVITRVGENTSGRWLRLQNEPLNVRWFGATSNGEGDDSLAIQFALNAAECKKAEVCFPSGKYRVDSRLMVCNGVKGILGLGGVIVAGSDSCGFLLAGKQSGKATNVDNCTISGLHIDAAGKSITAIEAQNVNNVMIHGNVIENMSFGYGILVRTYKRGQRNTQRVVIEKNTVRQNANVYGVQKNGIAIDVLNAELEFFPYSNEVEFWKANFEAAKAAYFAEDCVISNNEVSGGYYGVSIVAAKNSVVKGNVVKNNTRNISIQHAAKSIKVHGNFCGNSASSAIHMNMGASNSVISSNTIRNSFDRGEASIQLYRGCMGNTVIGNNVVQTGKEGNDFFIYIGPKCSNSKIIRNNFAGNAAKAAIGIESAWNPDADNPASYAFEASGASRATDVELSNIVFALNSVRLTNGSPVVFLGAIGDQWGKYDINRCFFANNNISTTGLGPILDIYEFKHANVGGLTFKSNSFDKHAGGRRFIMPRGWRHFSRREGNQSLDTDHFVFPDGQTRPNISFGGSFRHSNSKTTLVQYYTGGRNGLEIVIRLDEKTILIHDASKIKLIGDANLIGMSSNQIITFFMKDGVWHERSRNF
jgi:parallel beta-helix repeat protein